MTYDTVLFDFDGVIAESPTERTMLDAFRRTCDHFRRSLPEEQALREFLGGDFDAIADRCTTAGIDPDRFCAQATVETIRTQWRAVEQGARSCYADVEAVRSLTPTLGVVSDNHPTVVSLLLRRSGLARLFETVRGCPLTREGLAQRKPDPSNIESALSALDARDAVYVGDRNVDVAAATDAEIDSVLVERDPVTTTAEPTYRVDSLRELPALVE